MELPKRTKLTVSSTAAGTSRRALLADDDEAWTATAVPAWINFTFPEPVSVGKVGVTFQGGFVATAIRVLGTSAGEGEEREVACGKVFPEDVSRRQVLELPTPATDVAALRLELETSSDHYGRVTMYRLELLE